MKPIEAGCKCRIVNSSLGNEGKIVTALYVVADAIRYGNKIWKIDTLLNSYFGQDDTCSDYFLEPISDYDGNNASSWDALSDIWNPTKTTVQQH